MKRKYILIISLALIIGIVLTITISIISQCFYRVSPSEQAVVLRFGEYHKTTSPGFYFKIPFIDSIDKVKVDYQYKQEIGFTFLETESKSISWILTEDLNSARFRWIIHYRIKDPVKYSFNVNDADQMILDIFTETWEQIVMDESIIMDESFIHDTFFSSKRSVILDQSKKYMQKILDRYEYGIQIQFIQLIPQSGNFN